MKITQYLRETKAELKHVAWPTRQRTVNYTLVVIALSVLVAYFLGLFDFVFSLGLSRILGG